MDGSIWDVAKYIVGAIIIAAFLHGALVTVVRHGINESERMDRIEGMLEKLLRKEGLLREREEDGKE